MDVNSTTISNSDIKDFIKLLIEIGNYYKIDDDNFINIVSKNERLGINVNSKVLPVQIFNENMQSGEWIILNPFLGKLESTVERDWFFESRSVICSLIMREMILKMTQDLIDTTNEQHSIDYSQMNILAQYIDRVDKKTIKELELIKAVDLGFIYYNKKERTAKLQCRVLTKEYQEELGGKVRKKTWEYLAGLMEEFLQTETPEITYCHRSTIIGMQECDAVLHVLVKLLEAISPYAEMVLKLDTHIGEIKYHMEFLEKYHNACLWFTSSGYKSEPKTDDKIKNAIPWKQTTIPGSVIPIKQTSVPTQTAADVMPALPTQKVIQNTDVIANVVPGSILANRPISSFIPASQCNMQGSNPMYGNPMPTFGAFNRPTFATPSTMGGPIRFAQPYC